MRPQIKGKVPIPRIVYGLLLSVLVNGIFLIWIGINQPSYLHDYRLNINPDARHYVLLGRNFFLLGTYSRSSSAPYAPDMFRTPGYPLFAGGLDILGGAALIYVTQAVLQSVNCVIIFLVTRKLFGDTAGLIAGILCGTDLMLAVLNFEPLSESVYVFLISVSALVLLPRILEPRTNHIGVFFLGGLLLGLAIHVRAAGLYLPVVYSIATLIAGIWGGWWKKAVSASLALMLGAAVLIVPWVMRNYAVFGIPRLSTNDNIVLAFYTGAGAYQVHYGVDLGTAQRMIAQDFGLRPTEEMFNPWISKLSPKELDDSLRETIPAILSKYPLDLLKASTLGVLKASISHNVDELAAMLGIPWSRPELGRILRLDMSALHRLLENHTGLVAVFLWQVIYVLCLMLLTVCGFVNLLWTREKRRTGVVLLALFSFFIATLGASGFDAYSRFRSPIMPTAYMVSAYMLALVLSSYSRTSSKLRDMTQRPIGTQPVSDT
jgi:4-amino-4-deoxy-L-arabinose transferase-like glycosyltransferase